MIYLASSWKNPFVGDIVDCLEQWAIPYYNFKDDKGFHWSEVDPEFHYHESSLTFERYLMMISHPRAEEGFERDFDHLKSASALVLILPCNRSAHLELGYACGSGIPTAIYFKHERVVTPELMYKMVGLLTKDIDTLMQWCLSCQRDYERELHQRQVLNTIDEMS